MIFIYLFHYYPVSPSVHSSGCLTFNLTVIPLVQLSISLVFIEVYYVITVTGDCTCLVIDQDIHQRNISVYVEFFPDLYLFIAIDKLTDHI